jgi:hypothetical protein
VQQRAAAAWPPRAVPTQRLKATVETARRTSRQLPGPRRSRPRPTRRADRRLLPLTRPTAASCAPPSSRQLAPRPPWSEAASPGPCPPSPRPQSPVAVSAPVSRRTRRLSCADAVSSPAHRAAHAHAVRCARAAHALCAWAEPTPQAWATRTVRLGRARIRPSCTRLNFINF